jgi:hypothetical protein
MEKKSRSRSKTVVGVWSLPKCASYVRNLSEFMRWEAMEKTRMGALSAQPRDFERAYKVFEKQWDVRNAATKRLEAAAEGELMAPGTTRVTPKARPRSIHPLSNRSGSGSHVLQYAPNVITVYFAPGIPTMIHATPGFHMVGDCMHWSLAVHNSIAAVRIRYEWDIARSIGNYVALGPAQVFLSTSIHAQVSGSPWGLVKATVAYRVTQLGPGNIVEGVWPEQALAFSKLVHTGFPGDLSLTADGVVNVGQGMDHADKLRIDEWISIYASNATARDYRFGKPIKIEPAVLTKKPNIGVLYLAQSPG